MMTEQGSGAGTAPAPLRFPSQVPSPGTNHPASKWLASGQMRRYGLWIALFVVVVVLSAVSPSFRSGVNLTNILQQNAMIGIVACGQFVMMVSGGFDLSVGAVGATASVAAAYVTSHGNLGVAIAVALLIGAGIGILNGLLIVKVRINAFMTTFAMASIVLGLLFVATSAGPVKARADVLTSLAFNRVAGVPLVFVAYIVVVAFTWLLMTRTKWGHYVYSTGGNRDASFLSGVPVVSTQALAFAFGGFTAALAALVMLGQSNVGQPGSATNWPLNSIAICVIAGVALSGGEGRIQDTVAATLLLGAVGNGLNLLDVSPYLQPTVTGSVILLAVVFDRVNRDRQRTRT